jgi:hypothetical protein
MLPQLALLLEQIRIQRLVASSLQHPTPEVQTGSKYPAESHHSSTETGDEQQVTDGICVF